MKFRSSLSNLKQEKFFVAIILMASMALSQDARAQQGLKTYTGTFADGATYLIEVPRDWNKTLFLYSHGYIFPDTPNPTWDNADVLVRLYLLSHGFALAGSSYASTGWAIQDAFKDQIAVLDEFNQFRRRKRLGTEDHIQTLILSLGVRHTAQNDNGQPCVELADLLH